MSKGNHSSKTTKGLKGRKNHGPKRNLFSDYGAMTWKFGKLGLLDKYHDFDSFKLACMARGCKNPTKEMWKTFSGLGTRAEQDGFLNNIDTSKHTKKKPIVSVSAESSTI